MADEQPKALSHGSGVSHVPEVTPLNYVPEVILKKRKNNEEWAIKRRQQLEERVRRIKHDKTLTFKRAEHFIKEHRNKELDLIQMKQRGKRRKTALMTPKSKLLFIIRIQGKYDIHPKTKKILRVLGLGRVYSGVFLKANEGNLKMLQLVEPYVTYGYPNLKNIKELIYKKGYAKIDKQKVPLTDNIVIEEAMGKHGIICLEDIVHEVANVGPHFKEVTNFMWPFKLSKPEGLKGLKKVFKEGGDSGNREDQINELISRMN